MASEVQSSCERLAECILHCTVSWPSRLNEGIYIGHCLTHSLAPSLSLTHTCRPPNQPRATAPTAPTATSSPLPHHNPHPRSDLRGMLRLLIAILIILTHSQNYYDCLLLGQATQSPLLNTALLVRRLLKLLHRTNYSIGTCGGSVFLSQPTFILHPYY